MSGEKFYKIKNPDTGEYSAGGMYPRFTKLGKRWRTLGHIRAHLAQTRLDVYPSGCEIVECEVVETNSSPLKEEIIVVLEKQRAERDRRAIEDAERKLRSAKKLVKELNEKYGDLLDD